MTLHQQARDFLDALAEQDAPGWSELSPAEGREVFSSLTEFFGPAPDVARVENRTVGNNVSVRIYFPHSGEPSDGASPTEGPQPGIVYFHGGGWVLGDLDTHDALCRRLADEATAVVVAVDYRRSPETRYPGALQDCYEATQFVADQAASLGVDPAQIVVAGDSAGGTLAAAVALMAHQQQGPRINLQVLIYPVMDHRCDTDSYREFATGFGLTKESMQWFWQQYLGDGADQGDPLATPLTAENLNGLPPALIMTAQYDVLRDEGEQYAGRLQKAGVSTTLRRYDGTIHGFVHFAGLFDAGLDAVGDIAAAIVGATAK